MAKGDDSRARNKNDEQQKLAQGYLAGLQNQLQSQYGGFAGNYFGGVPSSTNSTYGYGSTVPHFSWSGSPYFSGNGTDTPTQSPGVAGGYGGDPQTAIMQILKSYGGASSENLQRALPQIQAMFPGTRPDSSGGPLDELVIPGMGVVDLISNAEGGGAKDWTFQTGGGGGFGNMGGIPGLTLSDYGGIMGRYGDLLGDYKDFFGDMKGKWGGFLGSASNMANTGGLSDADKGNIRSRAISPIRAVYANALRNVDRQRAIQGGYSPGYTTAMGRFNREMGQGVSDATTNAEGMIAELVQKGKLGGLSAWGSGLGGMTAGLGGLLGGMGNTLGGMTGLYSASPGLAGTFGSQALQAMGQQLSAGGLQNQLALGTTENQINAGRLPGKFQSAMGNIGSAINLGGSIAGMAYPWFGGGMPNMGMGTTVSPGTSYGYAGGAGIDPNSMFTGY